jgi:hypothetical protein
MASANRNSVNSVDLPDLKSRLDGRDIADRYCNSQGASKTGKCGLCSAFPKNQNRWYSQFLEHKHPLMPKTYGCLSYPFGGRPDRAW